VPKNIRAPQKMGIIIFGALGMLMTPPKKYYYPDAKGNYIFGA
jgi:hypothetical protein